MPSNISAATALPPIARLPIETIENIVDQTGPGEPSQTPATEQPVTPEQKARDAARTRAAFQHLNRQFRDGYQSWLNLKRNEEAAYAATGNAVRNLAKLDNLDEFKEKIKELFSRNTQLEIDTRILSPAQRRTALDALMSRARGTPQLENIRLKLDLDHLESVDQDITTLRNASIPLKLHLSSHDPQRRTLPDFGLYPEMTHLDLRCSGLRMLPGLTDNVNLTDFKMTLCTDLDEAPDLSGNPNLAYLDLSGWSRPTRAPNLSGKAELKSVKLNGWLNMRGAPNVSECPKLTHLEMNYCNTLNFPPNTSGNPDLISLKMRHCTRISVAPNVRHNQNLAFLDLWGCRSLHPRPDYSGHPNPALTVYLDPAPRIPRSGPGRRFYTGPLGRG